MQSQGTLVFEKQPPIVVKMFQSLKAWPACEAAQ